MQNSIRKGTPLDTKRLPQAYKKLETVVRNVKNNWIQSLQ